MSVQTTINLIIRGLKFILATPNNKILYEGGNEIIFKRYNEYYRIRIDRIAYIDEKGDVERT